LSDLIAKPGTQEVGGAFGDVDDIGADLRVSDVEGSGVGVLEGLDEENSKSCCARRQRIRHHGVGRGLVLVKVRVGSERLWWCWRVNGGW